MDYDRHFLSSTPIKSISKDELKETSNRQQRNVNMTSTNRTSAGPSSSSSYLKNCTRSSSTTSKFHNGSKNNNHITFNANSLTNSRESPIKLKTEMQELIRVKSELAFENEALKSELNQALQDVEQLRLENQHLHQVILDKDEIQTRLRSQLNSVIQTAYTFYEKFAAFKCRYYKEQARGMPSNHDWFDQDDGR